MTKPTRRSWAFAALVLTAASFTVAAQPAAPTLRSSSFYTVKPDRVGDFLAATKEYAEIVRSNGSERHFSLWVSQTGEHEYVLVRYHSKWADLDTAQDPKLKDVAPRLIAVTARIMNCVEKYRRVIHGLEPELSLPLTATPPPMVRVLRTWVRPDKTAEYRAIVKGEILPAARKGGAKVYGVSSVRLGGSAFEFNSVMGIEKWADMDTDGPVITGLGGREAYNKLLAKVRPLITRSEYQVYRLMKDQSYLQ